MSKVQSTDWILSIAIKLFIITSLFFPMVIKESRRNPIFIFTSFICFIIIMICAFRKSYKTKHTRFIRIFILVLFLYNIVCLVNNLYYSHYIVEQINKNMAFIFIIMLIKKFDSEYFYKYGIIKFLIKCICITVILSLIFFFIGGEGIVVENFNIRFRRQGVYFTDTRLTWIFGHKSTYALLLLLFYSLFYKYRNIFKNKFYFIISSLIIIFAVIISGSATSLILLIIILFCNIVSKKNIGKKKFITKFCVVFTAVIFCIVGGYYMYNIVATTRDITTLGSRIYIYEGAIEYLKQYPNGIGKEFGELVMPYMGIPIENFHNIFLNEMLRFSIPVGIIYTILFIILNVYIILTNNKIRSIGVVISCFILFCMDYSLTTETLPLFLFLMFLLFFIDENTIRIKKYKEKK